MNNGNKIRDILYASFFVMLFHTSCIEDGPKVYEDSVLSLKPMSLSISQTSFYFDTNHKSTQQVTVNSTNVEWEFSNAPNWVNINPQTGVNSKSVVSITCAENTDVHKDRMAVVYFKSKGDMDYYIPITITQVRDKYIAIPEKDTLKVSWESRKYTVKIESNNNAWNATAQDDLSEWCTVTKQSSAIEISCKENRQLQTRSGHIIIKTPDNTRTLTVVQSSAGFNVSSENVVLPASSGGIYIQVQTAWDARWTVKCDSDWIWVNPSEGVGINSFYIRTEKNPSNNSRSSKVTVSTQGYSSQITVTQRGQVFEVYSTRLNYNSQGGDMRVYFNSSSSISATTKSSWIKLSNTGYTDRLEFTVWPNTTTYSRKDTIWIHSENSSPVALEVVQAAPFLIVSQPRAMFYDERNSQIVVQADGEYKVKCDAEWITYTKNGDVINISATQNTGKWRKATFTISMTGLTEGVLERQVSVVQYGSKLDYVNLGLNVVWATCNLGAENREDVGDYFAWGAIEKTNEYSWASYKYCNGSSSSLTKYSTPQYGWQGYWDYYQTLLEQDDAAYVTYGEGWRVPTIEDFNELIDNCTWRWTILNGVSGYKISSKKPGYNDRYIFLPAAGYKDGSSVDFIGIDGYYWTNKNYSDRPYVANDLHFNSNSILIKGDNRCLGMLIRPVGNLGIKDTEGLSLSHARLDMLKGEEPAYLYFLRKYSDYSIQEQDITESADWYSSNKSVATVAKGEVTVIGEGSCVITALYGGRKYTCSVQVSDPTAEYVVDLGLSVKWLSRNIGAYYPWDHGDRYAWGETVIKDVYSESNYKGSYTKYNQSGKTVLEPEDDVAHLTLSGSYGKYRIPTLKELEELLDTNNCSWTFTHLNGVGGYKVTGKNGDYGTIFIPALGAYWSSSLYDKSYAYGLSVSTTTHATKYYPRYNGLFVRAVCP